MKLFKNLTTSRRTSIIFALSNLFLMVFLMLTINFSYFYLWYEDQKIESLYDMNINYDIYSRGHSKNNIESFKVYISTKNAIIISPVTGKIIQYSKGVAKLLQNSDIKLNQLKESFFYMNEINDKIYLVFTQKYDEIGIVKVLFDTTPYIKSQILIIKITLIISLIGLFVSYFIGKLFTKYTLRDLRKISQEAKNMSLDSFNEIECDGCNDDEVKILANTINQSILRIKNQSQNLKQFITDVSHEFKTPLMVINSKIDVYRKMQEKGKTKPEDFDILLNIIKDRTKKLNNILETLFLLSRKTEGIEKLDYEKVDMSEYLPCYIDEYLANSDKKVTIKYYFDKPLLHKIDKNIFNIIIDNLVSNAVKFSHENGTIKVGGNDNEIWFQDFGTGMEEQTLKNIWAKFYREDINREGFGVGLFIVSRIIQLFKWKIDVISEKNKGSKFIITF